MSEDLQDFLAWVPSLKYGLGTLLLFVFSCFVYGWFYDFTFWHAHADAGVNSAIAHLLYYGVFAGPIVLLIAVIVAKFVLKK